MQSISLKKEILDEINTILYRFIWKKDSLDKKAWERIKRNVLCNSKEKGGLEMINMHDFQKSFLIDWACRLINEEQEDWTAIPKKFLKTIGGISIFKSKITSDRFKGLETIESSFWRSVLQIWLDNNQTEQHIRLSDTINNNNQVTLNNQVLFVERAIQGNIIYIKDMMIEGQLISFDLYENRIGRHPSNLIDYLTLRTALSKIKNEILLDHNKNVLFKNIDIKQIKRKKIYQLIKKEELCYCETMWENKLGNNLHPETWVNLFKNIKETKLIEIQYKILHNIFPTNILLNRIGIKHSEKCDFCNEKDYVEHCFYKCNRLKPFWDKISTIINTKINMKITLSEKNILLGIEQDHHNLNMEEIKFINSIILIGKLAIIKNKFHKIDIDLIFDREINLRKDKLNR